MKTNTALFFVFMVASATLFFVSCKKDRNCNETNNSAAGESESHNFGMNCMNCHTAGGKGEGCFNAAGSVSDSLLTSHLSSGTVKFYTQPDGAGQLKYTIPIDEKGNFFTTESISVNGLYPAITGPDGTTNYMSSSLTNNACNSCHGVTTLKLWAK
jgi:hypothetical protein